MFGYWKTLFVMTLWVCFCTNLLLYVIILDFKTNLLFINYISNTFKYIHTFPTLKRNKKNEEILIVCKINLPRKMTIQVFRIDLWMGCIYSWWFFIASSFLYTLRSTAVSRRCYRSFIQDQFIGKKSDVHLPILFHQFLERVFIIITLQCTRVQIQIWIRNKIVIYEREEFFNEFSIIPWIINGRIQT